MILRFFDFDGCLFDTPMPDEGKLKWGSFYNTPYPHEGWWGRLESMDLVAFDILRREEVYKIYNDGKGEKVIDFVLTSRLLRFQPMIKELLKVHDINIPDANILTKNKYEKGERVLQTINDFQKILNVVDDLPEELKLNITDVYFYDDRDKEIISAESVKEQIEDMGINFHIVQIIN